MPKDCRYTRYAATFLPRVSEKLFIYSYLRPLINSRKGRRLRRYNPLHLIAAFPSQHILNRFVENIGLIPFYDDLRPIYDDLKSGYDDLSALSDDLNAVHDDLTFVDDDLS